MKNQQKGSVLITGASAGIGKACALLLDQCGYQVFAGVRSVEKAEGLQQEASEYLLPVMLDITKKEQVAKAVEVVAKALCPEQGLKGLVNNAGIVVAGPLEFIPLDSLRRQMEVNVIGQVAVTQAFLPLIRKAHGRIINITTAGCHFAAPFLGPYVASKIAMEALTGSLRRELRQWGIQVSIVEPGIIETPIWEKSFVEADKMEAELPIHARKLYAEAFSTGRRFIEKGRNHHSISPETVSKAIQHALEARRPKTRYVVGIGARLPNLIATFVPDRLADWVVGKVLGI